ncbi:hypothetical protein E2C01_100294 [Portunus trituberculatus]|uniref:Uncharacterized protein n=1 Tax=Portunus trituberculatus TaxID=210409 RepID=A0A5B7KH66_PORTR|nr:hypothetical protein [Portunus trituberculatus]
MGATHRGIWTLRERSREALGRGKTRILHRPETNFQLSGRYLKDTGMLRHEGRYLTPGGDADEGIIP